MAEGKSGKTASGNTGAGTKAGKAKGGDAVQQAEKWGGGAQGSKGPVTAKDKRNPNASAKT